MALPDWLREQTTQHENQIKGKSKLNDDLSVKLGNYPYRLSLQTRIENSVDGGQRSMQLELFFHNEKTRPSNDASILAVSVPFKDQASLSFAKNERGYFADRLFDYMVSRLSISASENLLKQSLSVMVDKYLARDDIVTSPHHEAIRPDSKSSQLIAATIVPRVSAANKRNTQSGVNSKSPKREGAVGDALLRKVPPIAMLNFLDSAGAIAITRRSENMTNEENIYFVINGSKDKTELKVSMNTAPDDTLDSRLFVFQHNRDGGNGGLGFVNKLIESYGMLEGYGNGDAQTKYNNFVNSLPTPPNWEEYDIELKSSSIRGLGNFAQARQPISFNNQNKTYSIVKPLLCDWRGLSEKRVSALIKDGTIRSGFFHNAKRNSLSGGGFFFYNKSLRADQHITATPEPDEHVPRFQRMMKLKENNKDKLKKFASGSNKGYFSGSPKGSADVLWVTEASIDVESMKDLNDLCVEFGVPAVEDNCIALLSTSGLKEFLSQRFGVYVKTDTDSNKRVISTTLLAETRSFQEKTLDDGDKALLSKYFASPVHFVTDGTNDSNVALSRLQEFANFATGRNVPINVIPQSQQFKVIKGFGENKDNEGLNKVFDKDSVNDFMLSHRLTSRYDGGNNQMEWSVSIESVNRRSFNSLSANEKADLQQKAQVMMQNYLGVRSLGNAFDNDRAGQDVGKTLKMVCDALKLPYSSFSPKPSETVLSNRRINIKDHNDVLMSARGLVSEGRVDECRALLQSWSDACKLAPELAMKVENKQENGNVKYGR